MNSSKRDESGRLADTTPVSSPAEFIPPPSALQVADDLDSWNILVGRISGRWDRASLKIKPIHASAGRFDISKPLCIATPQGRRLATIQASYKSGHSFIIDCGLHTIEEAEALRGAELFVHPSMRPSLGEGEFYFDQLIGLQVVTEAGEELGEIEEVLETPAHAIYVTPEAMIPGVEEFVVRIDWDSKMMVVHDVPGLRD